MALLLLRHKTDRSCNNRNRTYASGRFLILLWSFFRPAGQKMTYIGPSLADHVQFPVGRFFALAGRKTTHNNDKVPCCRRRKRCEGKSYYKRMKEDIYAVSKPAALWTLVQCSSDSLR